MPLMSGANDETYESLIEKSSVKSPSEPTMTASDPCSASWFPKVWAWLPSCHGSNATSASLTRLTSAEKSVVFWLIDSRFTVTPASSSAVVVLSARPVEYEDWSSMTQTVFAPSVSAMNSASVGPCAASLGTSRKNVGYLPLSVSFVSVAEGEMNASFSRVKIGPTASTSWLPAGPSTPRMSSFETTRCAPVDACAGSSCVSTSSSLKSVPLSSLNFSTAYLVKSSCSCPIEAASPVYGPIAAIEPVQDAACAGPLDVPPPVVLELSSSSPPQPAAAIASDSTRASNAAR